MQRVLVTYATMSGSTAEVAQAVADGIAASGAEVEVRPLDKVLHLSGYHAVALGAPMVMGWHRAAIRFLKKQRKAFKNVPVAMFATAMSLTAQGETAVQGVPVSVDPSLAKVPQDPVRLSLRERWANIAHYATPMLQAAGPNKPVSVAFFGGRMDYTRLKPLPRLFVMLVIQAPPGDKRNWQFIRSWASSLPELFETNSIQS